MTSPVVVAELLKEPVLPDQPATGEPASTGDAGKECALGFDQDRANDAATPAAASSALTQIRPGHRRGDFAIGALAMFMQMGTGLVMLPATAVFLAPAELAFWSVFLTIQTLNSMLEFGFSPSFARNFTYIFAGTTKLSKEGVPDRTTRTCDLQALRNLIGASKNLYAKLGLLSFALLSTIGTLYLASLHHHLPEVNYVWPAWIIVLIAHPVATFFQWQYALLLGADRVQKFYMVVIVSRLTQVVFSVAALMIWPNVLVLAIGYGLSMIVFRVMANHFVKDIVKSVAGYKTEADKSKEMIGVVAHNAMKVGWVTLGAFLANRFNLLSFSMFVGAQSAAEYAISQQALNALASVSLVGVSMLTPMMANAHVHRDKRQLRELLSFVNAAALVIFSCGVIGLLVLGDPLLGFIHSKTMLPELSLLLLLCGIYWLDTQITISTQFILTSNRVPYLHAMVATGMAIAIGVLIAGFAGGRLTTFLWIQVGMLLAYNAWKWPLVAGREVGLTFANFIPSAISGAKRILVGRRATAHAEEMT
jgi:O-antigen/teichoic acid export membrane protein